jgi:hypothetical protein
VRTKWNAIVIPRLSPPQLVWINGGLGLLALVANGSAAVLLSRGTNTESAGILEAALWALVGGALIAGSIYALIVPSVRTRVVQFQTIAVLVLAAALATWGLVLAASPGEHRNVSWSLGFLTALGFYAAVCVASMISQSWLVRGHAKILWMIPVTCAVVDLLVFGRLMR